MVSLSTWVRYIAHKLEYSASIGWKNYTGGQITDTQLGDAVWKNLFQGKLTYMHWSKGEEMAPTIAGKAVTLVRKIPIADPNAYFISRFTHEGVPWCNGASGGNHLSAHEVPFQVQIDKWLLETLQCEVFRNEKNILNLLCPKCDKAIVLRLHHCNSVSHLNCGVMRLQSSLQPQYCGHIRTVFVGDVIVLKDPEKENNFLVRRLTAVEGYEMVSTDEKEEPFVLEKEQCWVASDNENLKAKEANDSRKFGPVQMTDIVGRVIYCLRNAVDHGRVENSDFSMQKDSPVLEVELDIDEMVKSQKD